MLPVKQAVKFVILASLLCPIAGIVAAGSYIWIENWISDCSYDPDGYSPCLLAHVIFDKEYVDDWPKDVCDTPARYDAMRSGHDCSSQEGDEDD